MKILAIETSCDETAIALVDASGGLKRPRFKILKNLVASQIKVHRPFGGVVPFLAKREHIKNLPILWRRIKNKELRIKGKTKFIIHKKSSILNPQSSILNSINIIAVTVGPGLEPALWTGIGFVKDLYAESRIKNEELRIVGVSHLEGHLYSFLLNSSPYILNSKKLFPAIALIVSGGHTVLIKMDSLIKYKKIGETRDDAVGESFDKVARLLGMSYPGGPEIEKLAKKGDAEAINFPRPMLNQKNYDFSFSGLKTAVLYYLRDNAPPRFSAGTGRSSAPAAKAALDLSPRRLSVSLRDQARRDSETFRTKTAAAIPNIAASFQRAAFDVLIPKTLRAAEEFNAKSIMVSGGVAANKALASAFRKKMKSRSTTAQLIITGYPGDNAAMIAVAGYLDFLQGKSRRLIAKGDMSL